MFIAAFSCTVSATRTVASSGGGNGPETDGDRLLVMFWNLENMFDYMDSGTGESDAEFSSFGQRRWTKARFYAKCNAFAKSVLWIADREGRLPDVMGIAEVENAFAARSVVSATALRKYGYRTVHFDSPDRRGIDVALLYREEVFERLSAKPCHVYDAYGVRSADRNTGPVKIGGALQAEPMETRDILLVSLRHRLDGRTYHFLVNHHPSKYGGAKVSEGRRRMAMSRLRYLCDSLSASGGRNVRIIAMGDFNDTPSGGPFGILCGTEGPALENRDARENGSRGHEGPGLSERVRMVNLGVVLEEEGEGTIRYGGKWELIDMFIVSGVLSGGSSGRDDGERYSSRMEVVRIPFLMTRDNTHVGEKPLRTYSGPRYLGGVSDHCPVILTVICGNQDFCRTKCL